MATMTAVMTVCDDRDDRNDGNNGNENSSSNNNGKKLKWQSKFTNLMIYSRLHTTTLTSYAPISYAVFDRIDCRFWSFGVVLFRLFNFSYCSNGKHNNKPNDPQNVAQPSEKAATLFHTIKMKNEPARQPNSIVDIKAE